MQSLLCERHPAPRLPSDILSSIDSILAYDLRHKSLQSVSSLEVSGCIARDDSSQKPVRIAVWKGDITTLDATVIVNAANTRMLGCFQPDHKCIDNVIHAAAGPRLRLECYNLMQAWGLRDTNEVLVTKGYNLPSQFVLHVAGPQLHRGKDPTEQDREELRRCYRDVLMAAEILPQSAEGWKSIAFCCISTGVFAFPADQAASIAIETVTEWITAHNGTTITDIIFDVFADTDYELYTEKLSQTPHLTSISYTSKPSVHPTSPSLLLAKKWISEADNLLITAGAGLSAATGLDYTSQALFSTHFPGFLHLGFRRLYDVFSYNSWPSAAVKWGYYFTHLNMVRNWPKSPLYALLLDLSKTFDSRGKEVLVRTSNADGFFVANGFAQEQVITPQGRYEYLQCLSNCRPDAYFPSQPFLNAAIPFLDAKTQVLTDESKIPKCTFCGGDMMLCVRAAEWFNETPFREGNRRWKEMVRELQKGEQGKTVILELGVGLSTPGVLRWPNEDLVASAEGDSKLIRAGIGPAGCVEWELEEEGVAIGIDGDLNGTITELAKARGVIP
jgi:O-acetyl-ADP-ribose deacetylase (regulator of RNase III)/NAD-dependent SIR2 family protein deacetylase